MRKIEGIYYSHRQKEDIDLSDVNFIRFNINETEYIDIQLKGGKLDLNASAAIKITMTGGNNCVNVSLDD